jgi:hypothetical protein
VGIHSVELEVKKVLVVELLDEMVVVGVEVIEEQKDSRRSNSNCCATGKTGEVR